MSNVQKIKCILFATVMIMGVSVFGQNAYDQDVQNEEVLDPETKSVLNEVKKPDDMSSGIWNKITGVYKNKMSRNDEIQFHGRLLDPDNNPVSNASVKGYVLAYDPLYLLKLGSFGSDQKKIQWETETDGNGNFVVSGMKGLTLHVDEVQKSGYVSPPFEFTYLLSKKHYRADVYKQSADNPVKFVVWPINMTNDSGLLVKKQFMVYGYADGAARYLDLIRGRETSNMMGSVDVAITIVSNAQTNDMGARYDWSLVLSAVDGGVIETEEIHAFRAPVNGYKSNELHVVRHDDNQWSRSVRKTYYVNSRSNKIYAAMTLNVYAYFDGKTAIDVESLSNTNGSPNLMPLLP